MLKQGISTKSSGHDQMPKQPQIKSKDHHPIDNNDDSDIEIMAPITRDDPSSESSEIFTDQVLGALDMKNAAIGSNTPQDIMSLETNMMSGIDSRVLDSVTMLSLGATAVQDDPVNETDAEVPSLCCIHEGDSANVYRLSNPTKNNDQGVAAVAVKVLSDQFPETDQIAQLENERKMSSILSGRCAAVRPAVNYSLSRAEMEGVVGKEGDELDSSRVLYLEWLPGLTLREWVHRDTLSTDMVRNSNGEGRLEYCARIAWQIAHSLHKIHDTGGAVLNNISSDNIIIHFPLDSTEVCTIHMIDLGSASFIQETQDEGSISKVQQDLCSLGDVLFELFSGESPNQSQCHANEQSTEDKKISSVVISESFEMFDQKKTRRPLRELRFVLSLSAVPCKLAAFILELMCVVGSNSAYCYASAKEVKEQLSVMLLQHQASLLKVSSQESAQSKNCLFFDQNILCGRELEQMILLDAFERVIVHQGACEVVLVSGFSGAGKTVFVEKTLQRPLLEKGGSFLHVKFDQICQVKPLAAMLAAFTNFCESCIFVDDAKVNGLMTDMVEAIGMEGLAMLAKLIPSFQKFIHGMPTVDATSMGSFREKTQLIFVFQAFVRAITGPKNPMVLFLDDLQWADPTSLHLLRALIMDPKISSLLFVESYRKNEVTLDSHPFSAHMSDIKATSKVVEIEITNLQIMDVNKIIAGAISEQSDRTASLSNIVYRKTGGNAFLVIQFVKSLWDEGLIWFSFYEKHWVWDTMAIDSRKVLEDAAELIAQKLSTFPPDLRSILQIMVCLGSNCKESILRKIAGGQRGHVMESADEPTALFDNLDIAVREGVIIKDRPYYKFTHDQIQHAAYSLIPHCEQNLWHLHIGMKILRACEAEELDNNLFVVVDQLNRGNMHIKDPTQQFELAVLNYRAAEKARLSGVFSSAASYLELGMSLLCDEPWNVHYDLWLSFYTSYVEMEYCNGNFEKALVAVDCVITHGKCFDDKLCAYCILVYTLGAQKRFGDAIEMGLDVMQNTVENFPSDSEDSVIAAEFTKTNCLLEGHTIDTLTKKVVQNKRIITIMALLENLCLYACSKNPKLLAIFVFRMIQLSLTYGFCDSTISGLTGYSIITYGFFGDLDGGIKYAELVLDIIEQKKTSHQHCKSFGPLYGHVLQRRKRLHSCIEPVLKAHHDCANIGETEYAIMNGCTAGTLLFQCGKELSSVEKFIVELEEKAIKYQQMLAFNMVLPLMQAITNLMGKENNPSLLEGKAFSFKEFMSVSVEEQSKQVLCRFHLYQMQIAYMFGDLHLASSMAAKARSMLQVFLGKFEVCEHLFYDGLISFAKAQKTNADIWKTLGLESIKKMQKWAVDAPWNCKHKLCLLEAEQCFLSGETNKAIDRYELAIKLSGENGFIQDQALCYERASIFFYKNGDTVMASQYYGKAHNAYVEWGAEGKACHLCTKSPF